MSATAVKQSGKLPEPLDSLIVALNSLPVAIVVMLLLTILSVLGTFIPQENLARPQGMTLEEMYFGRFGPLVFYTKEFGPLVVKDIQLIGKVTLKIPQSKHALVDALGFKHIYFTPYFFFLLVWLAVSAIVCNITRFKRTMRLWKKPKVLNGGGFFRADDRAVVLGPADGEQLKLISGELKSRGYRVRQQAHKDGTVCIYGDKSFWKQWALLVLHGSILVLILGAAYGKIYGVEDYVRMGDGERKSLTLDLHKGKISMVKPLLDRLEPITFELAQDNFHIDYDKNIQIPGWLKESYDKGDVSEELLPYHLYFVKEFVSDFTISRNGKSVTQEVKVNHPIKLDKLVMYQSGYQQIGYVEVEYLGETKEYQCPSGVLIGVASGGLVDAMKAVSAGQPVAQIAFAIQQVKAGDLYIQGENTGFMGPLTIAEMYDMTTMQSLGRMLLSPDNPIETTLLGEPLTIKMSRRVDNYSDFSYKRDPGIPILYLGWIAMIVGISVALYIPFTQVWLRFEPTKTYALVAGGGSMVADSTYGRWNDMLKQK